MARRREPQDVSLASLRKTLEDITFGSGVREYAAQAIAEASDLADEFEGETGERPSPYALQQPGVSDPFESWVREREERERAALERDHAAHLEARHQQLAADGRELRERRAEQTARVYLARLGIFQHDDSTYRR
jgi:hypothetical protein